MLDSDVVTHTLPRVLLTLLLGLTLQAALAQRCTDYVAIDGKLLNDVELGGAGAAGTGRSNVSVFGSGAAYRVEVSGLSATGPVTAAVSSNAAVDAAGNRSDRSTGDDPTVRYQP